MIREDKDKQDDGKGTARSHEFNILLPDSEDADIDSTRNKQTSGPFIASAIGRYGMFDETKKNIAGESQKVVKVD